MKKVMKFVKGKKEDESAVKNVPIETKKIVNEKIDDTPREDDFISRDKTITKLHKAVWNENSDKLKSIIKTHDIDITDKLDRTALYFAVLKNNPNIVNLLLGNGANQNIPDIDGITPFLKSVQLGYKQCAANLLNHGADIKKTDKDSNSCLHFATMGKQSDMLAFLLEHNADCNIPNVNGEFPLHIAVEMQDKQMVEILLNNNCEINIVNNSGVTPLMIAEQQNNLEIVELLENYCLKCSKDNNLFPDEISHKSSYENVNTPKIEHLESEGDIWNDKIPSTKIEITEEKSESDVSIKCSENTSPQSGIIPPPCKPLRSLEYLQSGMTMESRPVHLLTLGTVRTRHISMTESDHSKNNTPHRYSYQGDFQDAKSDSTQKLPDEKGDSVNISIKSKILSKLEYDSTLQSDWGSNESLPLDELSIGGKKEKSVTSSTSKTTSNSGSIKDKSTDVFLQKQFSLLEDYEKNREKRCSVSYEMDLVTVKSDKSKLDDIDNLLEDNNRINSQLEKYAGQTDTPVGITKSKSLPRNCEPYNYHKGSFSLPRTLESGKDPFREMKSYGYFKPRSHFSFSIKMLKGDKKSGFIDKLKNMFNKKSQIHLTEQSENGTWLYKKMDNEYSFSGDESFKRGDNLRTSKTMHNFCDFKHFQDDESLRDATCSNNEENKVIEKKNLAVNMNRDSTSSGLKNDQSSSTEEETKLKFKQKKDLTVADFCEDCSYLVALRLSEADENIKNKEKFIQLLKDQLELLKNRNIKSINEAQELYFKFNIASQEIINLKNACTKYDDELKKLRTERSHLTEFEQIVSTYKIEAERWKKQYEESKNLDRGEGLVEGATAEEKWRSIIQDEVSTAVNMLKENSQVVITSLEKQNKKLESMNEKLQNELDAANSREGQMQKDLLCMKNKLDEYKTQITTLKDDNKTYKDNIETLTENNVILAADFQRIDKLYSDLQKNYEENLNSIEFDFKKSAEISEDFNIVKEEYRTLTKSLSGLLEEIVKAKENALTKNEELRQQVAEMGPSSNMKQFIHQITLSLEKIGMPESSVSEPVLELSNSIADVEKINKLNTEIELQILEVKMNKKVASLQEENKKLKEDMLEKYDCLLTQIKESGEDIDEVSSELRNKKEIIQNQCYQICNLNELIQEEKQRNDLLEAELSRVKYEIQKEKICSMELSIENDELKTQLESSVKAEKFLQEENASIQTSLNKIQEINEDLNIQLEKAIFTITEMETRIVESQNRMENLEQSNKNLKQIIENLKAETIEEITKKYEQEIKIFVEENSKLQEKLQQEKANLISLQKHIDSFTFYHENEKIANNARFKDLKTNLELEIEKLTNLNMLQQDKIETIERENKHLSDNVTKLQKYIDTLESVNKENIEMKSAMSDLQNILGPNISAKSLPNLEFIEGSLCIRKSLSLDNLDYCPEVYTEKYKQMINNLQIKVQELQEETFNKKVFDGTNVEELRKELCKQKVERVPETEVFLKSKQKVLSDLEGIRNTLQKKHEEVQEVTALQTKNNLQDIPSVDDQPLPPLPSDVQKIVISNLADSLQENIPQSSQYPEIPIKPQVLVINARTKIKHRLTSESVPESSSEEELKNKYLLQ